MYNGHPMMESDVTKLDGLAKLFADDARTDVLIYNSEIRRNRDRDLIDRCRSRDRNQNVLLVLTTAGGDPDAAYRISRCLQDSYDRFTCLVGGYCKSAGTLIAVGASEIAMGDHGELGPIDVQMAKRDEIWELQSGLTVMASLKALHESALSAFEHFFLSVKRKSGGQVTLKTSMEIASKLTEGLFSPMYAQIDPVHVGEAARATAIAREYALRLDLASDNLKSDNALDLIIGGFPSHGFVIDQVEARSLFRRIRSPNDMEAQLLDVLGDEALLPQNETMRPNIRFLEYQTNGKQEEDGSGSEQGTRADTPQESAS